MTDWEYGGVYRGYDMEGEIHLPNNSIVQVCDWTISLPEFMKSADALFVDPPWNAGNAKSFYTKAGIYIPGIDFHAFSSILFQRIFEISPDTVFVEIGKQYIGLYLQSLGGMFKYVTLYNSSYYHRKQNKCYVIHATNSGKLKRHKILEDMDEEDIIKWLCRNHPYQCVGDLCMGRGLVGKHSYLNGRRFVGTELNPKRLAVLVDFIRSREAKTNE